MGDSPAPRLPSLQVAKGWWGQLSLGVSPFRPSLAVPHCPPVGILRCSCSENLSGVLCTLNPTGEPRAQEPPPCLALACP